MFKSISIWANLTQKWASKVLQIQTHRGCIHQTFYVNLTNFLKPRNPNNKKLNITVPTDAATTQPSTNNKLKSFVSSFVNMNSEFGVSHEESVNILLAIVSPIIFLTCLYIQFNLAECLLCLSPGNPYWRGRLNTLNLLINVGCFVKKVNRVFNI